MYGVDYLSTLDAPESAGTRRVYAGTLTALREHLGADHPVADLATPETTAQIVAWFTARWSQRGRHQGEGTNRNPARVIRSAATRRRRPPTPSP
jgi:hypothetical protein